MLDALSYGFMQNALFAGILASIVCGVIGSFVVVNRIVFISGGIAHAAYGGVGLAFFWGITPILGIMGFTLVVAVIMAAVSLKSRHRSDAVIGALWAIGMALGVLLIDFTSGYNVDLMSYLFGSILTVPVHDLWVMLGVNFLIILSISYFYHDFLALSFDPEFAATRGVRVDVLYFALMIMLALSVVIIIQVVGLILVIALLSIPPYIAERFSRSMLQMILGSIGLNISFTLLGLGLSFVFNLTSGASIIMVAALCFFLLHLFELVRNRLRLINSK